MFFSILRLLLKLSVWVAWQLLSFYVDSMDILNSYDREDTSAVELEVILVTVTQEANKSLFGPVAI